VYTNEFDSDTYKDYKYIDDVPILGTPCVSYEKYVSNEHDVELQKPLIDLVLATSWPNIDQDLCRSFDCTVREYIDLVRSFLAQLKIVARTMSVVNQC
jgi:hypothetical protein